MHSAPSALNAECTQVLCPDGSQKVSTRSKIVVKGREKPLKGVLRGSDKLWILKLTEKARFAPFAKGSTHPGVLVSSNAYRTSVHSVLSAELKLLHSVLSASQCSKISVHSVLSALRSPLFHCALESARSTVCGVGPKPPNRGWGTYLPTYPS